MSRFLKVFCLMFLLVDAALAQVAVRHDFDGDGKTEPVFYNPIASQWLVFLSGSDYQPVTVAFDRFDLVPIAVDFDGDRKADPAVYDAGNAAFYIRLSGSDYNLVSVGCGGEDFMPVAADFDGDAKADPAVYCITSGVWQCRLSSQNYAQCEVSGFGGSGFVPMTADYDGDRRTDLGVYHGDTGTWLVRTGSGQELSLALGGPYYVAVLGDFDNDGINDPAVYKEADGTWKVRMSSSGLISETTLGGWDMVPATGDYDGDGKLDLVVYSKSEGRLEILLSSCDYTRLGTSFDNHGARYPDCTAHPADNDWPLPYSNPDWMSSLDDNLFLSEITIPGTHDTGADEHTSQQAGTDAPYVIAQDYRLANQLLVGARWFDIRLCLDSKGYLTVFHGNYYLHKNFDDMLKPALNFVTNMSPNEVVVFMIKQEKSSASAAAYSAAVYKYLQNYGLDNFFLENRVPTLGEVRGKIVIIRNGFSNQTGNPLGMQFNWASCTSGGSFTNEGLSIYAQDFYNMNLVPNFYKINVVENTMQLSGSESDPEKFYMNFVSCEKDDGAISIYSMAANILPSIRDYINSSAPSRRCGVIMLDFAGGSDEGNRGCCPEVVQQIISLNDFYFSDRQMR